MIFAIPYFFKKNNLIFKFLVTFISYLQHSNKYIFLIVSKLNHFHYPLNKRIQFFEKLENNHMIRN